MIGGDIENKIPKLSESQIRRSRKIERNILGLHMLKGSRRCRQKILNGSFGLCPFEQSKKRSLGLESLRYKTLKRSLQVIACVFFSKNTPTIYDKRTSIISTLLHPSPTAPPYDFTKKRKDIHRRKKSHDCSSPLSSTTKSSRSSIGRTPLNCCNI